MTRIFRVAGSDCLFATADGRTYRVVDRTRTQILVMGDDGAYEIRGEQYLDDHDGAAPYYFRIGDRQYFIDGDRQLFIRLGPSSRIAFAWAELCARGWSVKARCPACRQPFKITVPGSNVPRTALNGMDAKCRECGTDVELWVP